MYCHARLDREDVKPAIDFRKEYGLPRKTLSENRKYDNQTI